MKKLVIDDATGIVENMIVADESFTLTGKILVTYTGQGEIGDSYDGVDFIKPIIVKTPEELQADIDNFNAQVDAELMQADMKIIRALAEGDTTLINAHIASQSAKRLTKK